MNAQFQHMLCFHLLVQNWETASTGFQVPKSAIEASSPITWLHRNEMGISFSWV